VNEWAVAYEWISMGLPKVLMRAWLTVVGRDVMWTILFYADLTTCFAPAAPRALLSAAL